MFFIGIFGLITSNNMIKSVVYVTILNGAVITFWIIVGSANGRVAPPIMEGIQYAYHTGTQYMSDPLPQALMITAVVIGFAVSAVAIVILITTYRKYQTTDWRVLFDLIRAESKGYITIPVEKDETEEKTEKGAE